MASIAQRIKNIVVRIRDTHHNVLAVLQSLDQIKEAIGRVEMRQTERIVSTKLSAYEFRVYSQFGEDGIIQFLINNIDVKSKTFVEFGVENYRESNTRFLLMHDNWRGLIMDGSAYNMAFVQADDIYWRYELKAVSAFVTRENINALLCDNGMEGEIGILSIDIDGNDYWVWKAISVVSPAIVIVEYNARFGAERAVTVPYKADFDRQREHYSMLYWGASLAAFVALGKEKGYAFVGCNSAGVNAFFVRKDLLNDAVRATTVEDGFVNSKFRQAKSEAGEFLFLSPRQEALILDGLPLVDVSRTD
jgi:hypothetical protein